MVLVPIQVHLMCRVRCGAYTRVHVMGGATASASTKILLVIIGDRVNMSAYTVPGLALGAEPWVLLSSLEADMGEEALLELALVVAAYGLATTQDANLLLNWRWGRNGYGNDGGQVMPSQ